MQVNLCHIWSPLLEIIPEWNKADRRLFFSNAADYPSRVLEKRQTRRMSKLSKMTVDHSLAAATEEVVNYALFASQHGEIETSTFLMEQTLKNEISSPMKFSQSVHNTAAGLFSIFKKATFPTSSTGAGNRTISTALTSVSAYLKCHESHRVLLTISDFTLPDLYHYAADELPIPFVITLILSNETGLGCLEKNIEPQNSANRMTTEAFLNSCAQEFSGKTKSGDQHCRLEY